MSNRFISAVFVVMLATIGSAFAADLPVKAPPAPAPVFVGWSGFYVGGNVGYGWGGHTGGRWSSFNDPVDPPFEFVNFAGLFNAGGNVLPDVTPRGVIGGVQVGYDWRIATNGLAGLVADFQFSDMDAEASVTITPPPGNTAGFARTTQSKFASIDWFGTVRARLGFISGSWLLYGTGGLAYGRVKQRVSLVCETLCPGVEFHGSNADTKAGWAAGAGVEYQIAARWTVGAEYLHIDLGSTSVTATPLPFPSLNPAASVSASSKFSADIARVTANYRF